MIEVTQATYARLVEWRAFVVRLTGIADPPLIGVVVPDVHGAEHVGDVTRLRQIDGRFQCEVRPPSIAGLTEAHQRV